MTVLCKARAGLGLPPLTIYSDDWKAWNGFVSDPFALPHIQFPRCAVLHAPQLDVESCAFAHCIP